MSPSALSIATPVTTVLIPNTQPFHPGPTGSFPHSQKASNVRKSSSGLKALSATYCRADRSCHSCACCMPVCSSPPHAVSAARPPPVHPAGTREGRSRTSPFAPMQHHPLSAALAPPQASRPQVRLELVHDVQARGVPSCPGRSCQRTLRAAVPEQSSPPLPSHRSQTIGHTPAAPLPPLASGIAEATSASALRSSVNVCGPDLSACTTIARCTWYFIGSCQLPPRRRESRNALGQPAVTPCRLQRILQHAMLPIPLLEGYGVPDALDRRL